MNNTNYIRWAESARVNWITHFAGVDPAHGDEWRELMTPKNTGLIMKSIKADFKLVSSAGHHTPRQPFTPFLFHP